MAHKNANPAAGDGGARQEFSERTTPANIQSPSKTQALSIDSILVGKRHRKDMGDVAGLAANMAELGLLQPIAVLPDGRLVGGARRLAAARALGWTEIPVHVVDIDAVVRGEFAENCCRKDFTPSELVAIGQEVERVERERAKQRMTLGKVSTGSDAGKTRDKTAARLGTWSDAWNAREGGRLPRWAEARTHA